MKTEQVKGEIMPVERVWLDYDYDDDYELTGEVMSGSLHGGEIHVTR